MKNIVRLLSASTLRGATIGATIEVQVTPGIGIHMVGLADVHVKESLLRIVTALQGCGYNIPGKKIIINIKRDASYVRRQHGEGNGWFDLPIALGILLASGQIRANEEEVAKTIFAGELRLDGKVVHPESSGFLHPADAARAVSWRFRDEYSVWGWECDYRGGDTWLEVKDLKDVVELLENTIDEKED